MLRIGTDSLALRPGLGKVVSWPTSVGLLARMCVCLRPCHCPVLSPNLEYSGTRSALVGHHGRLGMSAVGRRGHHLCGVLCVHGINDCEICSAAELSLIVVVVVGRRVLRELYSCLNQMIV